MAKMIDGLLLKLRLRRLGRLRDDRTFLASYLQLLQQATRDRVELRIKSIRAQSDALLFDPAIAAGVATPDVETARVQALRAVEERFKWRARALAQTRKRALAKHPGAATETRFAGRSEQLEKALSSALTGAERAFAPAANWPEAETAYAAKAEAVGRETALRIAAIRQKADAAIAKTTASYQTRVANCDQGIETLRAKLLASPAASATGGIPDGVILSVRNLSMRFGGLLAVDNLSFDVKAGEIFGLIGPNGAGKTTIFNCITRFYRATAGEILYRKNRVEVIKLNDYAVHDIIRQGIVRTFQNVELVWELTVLDNLLVAAHTVYRTGLFGQLLHTPKLRREEEVMRAKALAVLQTLGLLQYTFMSPYGLPYGILKKVELARTLMASPKLIILDEPAAGLNDKETEELAVLIKRIRDDYHATIFLVEHDMGLVMDVCDTICAISFGKKLALGTPAEIQTDKLVRSAYLGEES